jgi:hypothetical protein
MVKLMVSVRRDFSKFIVHDFHREQILGACRIEDSRKTTNQEKNDMLLCLQYYFNGVPLLKNGDVFDINYALCAAFSYVTASAEVRRWIESDQESFGITLSLDLENCTCNLCCTSTEEWYRRNQLFEASVSDPS